MLFLFLCLYISFYYIRPFEWIPGLIGSPLYSIVSFVTILILLIFWLTGKIRLFHYKTDKLMLGFSLSIALSHLSRGSFEGFYSSVISFIPIFLGYLLVCHSLRSKKHISWFLFLLLVLTVFLAFEGFLQFHYGTSHGGLQPIYQHELQEGNDLILTPRIRWFGPFNDPNDLGLALVMIIPFLINSFYSKLKFFTVPIAGFVIYTIFLTNSRGAMLSLFSGAFAYFVLRYKSLKGVVLGLALAGVGVFLGPSRMAEMSATESSAYGRLEAWYEGFQMFKTHPFFGVGYGRFTDFHYLTAHNSYVLVLAELGILGTIFFTGIFVTAYVWGWRNLLSSKPTHILTRSEFNFLCSLFGSLSGLLTSLFFLSRSYILLPFLLVGLLSSYVRTLALQDESNYFDLSVSIPWYTVFLVVIFEIVSINIIVKFLI